MYIPFGVLWAPNTFLPQRSTPRCTLFPTAITRDFHTYNTPLHKIIYIYFIFPPSLPPQQHFSPLFLSAQISFHQRVAEFPGHPSLPPGSHQTLRTVSWRRIWKYKRKTHCLKDASSCTQQLFSKVDIIMHKSCCMLQHAPIGQEA